jgi:hypothetical protein
MNPMKNLKYILMKMKDFFLKIKKLGRFIMMDLATKKSIKSLIYGPFKQGFN